MILALLAAASLYQRMCEANQLHQRPGVMDVNLAHCDECGMHYEAYIIVVSILLLPTLHVIKSNVM